MAYLIGTDEAGYGPNLGPLVISATVWKVPHRVDETAFAELVAGAIARAIDACDADATARLVIADSKELYKPALGIRLLEQHFLAALSLCHARPATWLECWRLLAPEAFAALTAAPWFADFDEPLPWEADADAIECLATTAAAALAGVGVELVAVRARVVFPDEFNELVERHQSKGEALSSETLRLAAAAIAGLERGPIRVICDKHGGRNRYGRHLQEQFPDVLVENYGESREQSVYRFGPRARRVEFCFRARGEAILPTALASMCSKYLRELAMRPFNRFWCQRVPELRPTAGYPGDARRFKEAIAVAQADLGIDDRVLWRER
ncbi:MAG: hypothetical protein JNG90_03110 [Planctomycetaceae bacterium]|nr:hypothetical protein [Planctomycetaceae bacterium]